MQRKNMIVRNDKKRKKKTKIILNMCGCRDNMEINERLYTLNH